MKRPGDILRERREKLELSLEELAISSKIPCRSLEALERDHIDFFSATTYYCGFLKSYAEILKLEPQILLDAYERIKILESPVPPELTPDKSHSKFFRFFKFFLWVFISSLLLLVLGWVGYSTVYPQERAAESNNALPAAEPPATVVVIDRYPWMQDLENDLILRFVLDSQQKDLFQPQLLVRRVGENFQLLSLNLGQEYELILDLGKTNILPLPSAGTDEQQSLFYLYFTLQDKESLLINLSQNNRENLAKNSPTSRGALGDRFAAFRQQEQKPVPHAILQAAKPLPLQLKFIFQRDSYIRYQWFGHEAQEFPVLKTKYLLLEGEAPLTLWLSDVDATTIQINGQYLLPEAFQNVFIGRLEWKLEANVARLYLTPIP